MKIHSIKIWKKFIKEVKSHKLIYVLLGLSLVGGFVVRVYRVGQILGFYFDQGRDALVIWNFLKHGDLFFIGPTTGIAGIFRGPFYYYLITPFYFLGGGNPVVPAIFLSFTTVVATALAFYLGTRAHSRQAGLFAAIIASFSLNLMLAGRWLSNPTPMLLLSMILIWGMFEIHKRKNFWWIIISFVAGSSLFHFGSAGEVFYFPALLIFLVWQVKRKNLPSPKIIAASVGVFLFTILPLVAFDIKNAGLLRNNIKSFLTDEGSFKSNFLDIFKTRINFYYDVFTNKIFHWRRSREVALLGVVAGAFIIFFKKLWKEDNFKILTLLFISPLVGLLFFQGNFGNIYDYYLTGYYLIFILLFAIAMAQIWDINLIGKLFIVFFLLLFLYWDGQFVRYKIIAGVDGENTIAFGNQKQAIDWVYSNAAGRQFNTDVYVPPVIPHAYDYLFAWYGGRVKGYVPTDTQIDLLYTLYEVDPPHPERLEVWLERQAGIGEIQEETSFGGITVQRRTRIENEQD